MELGSIRQLPFRDRPAGPIVVRRSMRIFEKIMEEVFCDFNAAMTEDCFLLTRGSYDDLERLGLTVEQAAGIRFTFYTGDADEDGNSDDLLADGIVVRHEKFGWVAQIEMSTFRHRSETLGKDQNNDSP